MAEAAELERQLRRVTLLLELGEQVYHMYPSFDRPVIGCNNCIAVAEAKMVLDPPDQHLGEQK